LVQRLDGILLGGFELLFGIPLILSLALIQAIAGLAPRGATHAQAVACLPV
jgi:hypothetical protein